MNTDKIIFFLHFHKSGGSTINYLFNKYNKHKPNSNGNPWSKSNTEIIFGIIIKMNLINLKIIYYHKKSILSKLI